MVVVKSKTGKLDTPAVNTWCPGCGNFKIEDMIKKAILDVGLEPHDVALVAGIGCHGKISNYVNVNSFHVIHGRVLPVATGIKLANHELTVIAHSGDGDAYAIGFGHFSHAARRNIDLTLIVHDNKVYGLTTGQTAPTSDKGFKTKSTPAGAVELPLNPLAIAIASEATFVARGYAGDPEHLAWLMSEAIKHKGFALIDVLQPCVTFNPMQSFQFYRRRVYKLEDEGHDPSNKMLAFEKTHEWGDRIPIGIFYQTRRPTFTEELPQFKSTPLAKQSLQNIQIKHLIEEFK